VSHGSSGWDIVGKGTGGVNEMLPLLKDTEALFALLSVAIGDSTKYVFVTWIGDRVGFLQQARINAYKAELLRVASVTSHPFPFPLLLHTRYTFLERILTQTNKKTKKKIKYLQPYAVAIQVTSREDISQEIIYNRLEAGVSGYNVSRSQSHVVHAASA
jgi:hypothetical protein